MLPVKRVASAQTVEQSHTRLRTATDLPSLKRAERERMLAPIKAGGRPEGGWLDGFAPRPTEDSPQVPGAGATRISRRSESRSVLHEGLSTFRCASVNTGCAMGTGGSRAPCAMRGAASKIRQTWRRPSRA